MTMTRILGALLFAGSIAGCALTSKADIVTIRYFSPERSAGDAGSPALVAGSATSAVDLRLGRISSGPNLRERIAYRDATYEVGYYEDQRWTERPEVYVRRLLARKLFEEHGFRRVLAGAAPVLEVEVLSFDEVRTKDGRSARVELKIVVSDDRAVLYEYTVAVERAVATSGKDTKIEEVVAAMSTALDVAVADVAARAQTALSPRR